MMRDDLLLCWLLVGRPTTACAPTTAETNARVFGVREGQFEPVENLRWLQQLRSRCKFFGKDHGVEVLIAGSPAEDPARTSAEIECATMGSKSRDY